MRLVCAEGSIYRTEMWCCVLVDFSFRVMSSRLPNVVNQTDGKVVSGPVAPVQLSQSVGRRVDARLLPNTRKVPA